jgi:hypothetical protein
MNSPLANYNHLIRVSKTPDSKEFERISTHDVIIITIGVAPCWFRKEDDSFVFSPDLKNINGFYQRTLTVQESSTAISGVINALRVINPRLKIIFTLSPVPLARTFEFDSAIVADCVSKSIIRAALHETLATEQAYYFPSFEIVRWVGAHRGDCFAEEDGLTRHVSEKYIEAIISSFIECFSDSGASTERY